MEGIMFPGSESSLSEQPVTSTIDGIRSLSRTALLGRWQQDWGKDPPKYVSRRLLELSAAWHLQCRMYGGPDREFRRLLRGSPGD
jgi:hypothetical protein